MLEREDSAAQRKKARDAAYYEANREKRKASYKARYKRTRTEPELAMAYLYATSRAGAKRRGIVHNITKQDVIDRYQTTDGRCERTGIEFVLDETPLHPFRPSLDRIDPTQGYEVDNIQIVVMLYNFAKNQATDADILHFARELLKNDR